MSTHTAERAPERAFLGVSAAVFAAGVAATVAESASMASMGAMPMPGGWSMSMTWMRMPDQTWAQVAVAFVRMWMAMTVAMMLPSLVPMLRRYRDAVASAGPAHLGRRTAAVAAGYFAVWLAVGAAALPVGGALASIAMRWPTASRLAPAAAGAIVLAAGLLQLSSWKRRRLDCCRPAPIRILPGTGDAWRRGLRLGMACTACCAGYTAILLAAGMMDLRVMAAVTAAIALERFAPGGDLAARAIGIAGIAGGVTLVLASAWR
jgi:predicted metal-binding membrane protein